MLYVNDRLSEDRLPVGLHPLLKWLPMVLYAVKDAVDAMGPVLLPVMMSSSVLTPPDESMANVRLQFVAHFGLSWGLQNPAEVAQERLDSGLFVLGSDGRMD